MQDDTDQRAEGPMLVLDTTALVADPACAGTAWRVLAQATRAWGIRILVPAVVLSEAVGGYARRVEGALDGLERWNDRHGQALGLNGVAAEAARTIRKEVDAYESKLNQVLADIGAEVLPMPEVAHAELVARAVARRRPCDDKGDGYRDTLNWFSVLTLLKENPSANIVWISENTADFAGDVEDELHEHLLEDLRAIGAEGRLTWLPRLSDAVAHIATGHVEADEANTRRVQEALERQAVSTFVSAVLAEQVVGGKVSPEKTGLPTRTLDASVLDLRQERSVTYSASAVAGETAVVEFSVEAEALIEVRLPLDHAVSDSWVVVKHDDREQIVTLVKPLRAEGILEVDTFGRPVSGEVSTVRALDDDPGLEPWAQRRTVREFRPAGIDLDAIREAVNVGTFDQFDAIRKATEGFKFDQFDAIRKATEVNRFDQLDAIRKATEGFKFDQLDAIRKATEGFKFDQLDAVWRTLSSMGLGPQTRSEPGREMRPSGDDDQGKPDPTDDDHTSDDGSEGDRGTTGDSEG